MFLDIKALLQKRAITPMGVPARHPGEFKDIWLKEISEQSDDFVAYIGYNNSLKEKAYNILDFYHIVGLFDLKRIFKEIGIDFQLIIFSKKQTKQILTGIHKGNNKQLISLGIDFFRRPNIELPVEKLFFAETFQNYLSEIEKFYNNNTVPKDTDDYEFNFVEKIDNSLLKAEFYTKQFIDNSKVFAGSNIRLGDIVDIKRVQRINENENQQYKTLKEFGYPLSYANIGYKTTHKIKKGDILLKSIAKDLQVIYIDETPKENAYVSQNQVVLHVIDERYSPEFLYLYLNSDTFKKYAKKYFLGISIPYLPVSNIKDFPIIPLSLETKYYEKIFKYQKNPLHHGKKYVDLLKARPLDNGIETELMLEEIKKLADKYNSATKENYMNDIMEVESCFSVGAYKATLILCGSILEGFLLDWLNELQPEEDWLNKQYVYDKKNKKDVIVGLNDYINQIEKIKRPDWMEESQKAHEIRKQRNLVHAKLCLKENTKITKELCMHVIKYLKEIVDTREGYFIKK